MSVKANTLVAGSPATIDALSGVLNRVFNVKRYGAVGDDVTDDSTAIQAAITACQAAGGGVVFFPSAPVAWRMESAVNIAGATQSDGFDNGGVTIRGDSQRGAKIHAVGGITAFNFPSGSRMMCHFADIEIYGDGKATAGSRAIYWNGTGGSYNWQNVYIHDLETGIEWYDSTLGVMQNVAVRKCGTGLVTGWNHDIFSAIGCRIDYCDTAIFLGKTSATHATRGQEENALTFLGCRISNNTLAVKLNDFSASGVLFRGCYWESNTKEVESGVSGTTDATGPIGLTFDGCYFTPVLTAPVAEGISIYNPALVTFRDCKTDGPTSYVIFCNLYDENARVSWDMNDVSASTAALVHQALYYNPGKDGLRITSGYTYKRDAGVPNLSSAWFKKQLTAGTGKIWESWTRLNSSTGATLAEIQVYDTGGVLRFGGVGSTPGYICATSIAALPTASVNYRGALAYVPGNGTTTADTLYACLLAAAGTYSWKSIVAG